jgi:hypothetical protein
MLAEIAPLIDCIPVDGPPLVFLLGPWLFLVLLLAGPFACLLAIVVSIIVTAAVLAAVTAAILAAPYLLVRHLRRHRARDVSISAPATQVVATESMRAAA